MTKTFGLRSRWVFLGPRRWTVDVPASLVSDDLGMLHEATHFGLGIAALPSYLVADDVRAGRLSLVLPKERLPGFRAYVVLPSGRHVPRRVRAFVDFLAGRLRGGVRIGGSATPRRRGR